MGDDFVSAPGTPRFDFVSSPEEITALMERARYQKEDGSRMLDAEAMFKILELVHGELDRSQ